MRLRELFAELVEVDCLVIFLDLVKLEFLAGNESLDRIILTELYTCTVHPGLVLVNKGKCLAGIIKKSIQNGILENEI